MTKHIVITGGAGHIGSFLTTHLLRFGHKITVIDSCWYGIESLLPFFGSSHLLVFPTSIKHPDAQKFLATGGYDAVLHLAAVVGEPAVKKWRDQTIDINVSQTKLLCEIVPTAIPVFYASTCSVYGIAEGFANEESPLNPQGAYAETKIAAEKYVLARDGIVLRFGTIIGLSPRMRWDTLAHEFIKELFKEGTVTLFNPQANRPFLLLPDLLEIIKILIGLIDVVVGTTDSMGNRIHANTAGEIFNVLSFNSTKVELATRILQACPTAEPKLIQHMGKGADTRDYAVSPRKLIATIGTATSYTLESAIEPIWRALHLMNDPFHRRYTNG